jgi:hypothetical protein
VRLFAVLNLQVCQDMVVIPAGSFVMGSPDGATPVVGLEGKPKSGSVAPAEQGPVDERIGAAGGGLVTPAAPHRHQRPAVNEGVLRRARALRCTGALGRPALFRRRQTSGHWCVGGLPLVRLWAAPAANLHP